MENHGTGGPRCSRNQPEGHLDRRQYRNRLPIFHAGVESPLPDGLNGFLIQSVAHRPQDPEVLRRPIRRDRQL